MTVLSMSALALSAVIVPLAARTASPFQYEGFVLLQSDDRLPHLPLAR